MISWESHLALAGMVEQFISERDLGSGQSGFSLQSSLPVARQAVGPVQPPAVKKEKTLPVPTKKSSK